MREIIIFRADSITKAFGSRQVLHSASLWARRGSIAALLGRNGSGKSTLMRIAAGLQAPDQGVVLFAGEAYCRARLDVLARSGLFYLPERGLLQRNLTVREHYDSVIRVFGGADRIAAAAALLRLEDLQDRRPDLLSGGERRRVELGLGLVRRPVCLLADEPFMGVAPRDAEVLVQAFRALAESGCAVIMSGHEVPLLLDHADEIIWLVAGTTHGLGTPAEARDTWEFRRDYLGPDTTHHGVG
jgi:lipopolysaccharide export system ATP-binding protein